jgi:exodeoxyribonuclease VII small subunit
MTKNFEELMKELEAEVRTLESGDLTLDKAIQSFEKGMTLARDCEKKLGEAKAKVEKIVADETGGEKEVPYGSEDLSK